MTHYPPADEYDPFEGKRAEPPDPGMAAYLTRFDPLPPVDLDWAREEYLRRGYPRFIVCFPAEMAWLHRRYELLAAEENLRRRAESARRAAIPEWP